MVDTVLLTYLLWFINQQTSLVGHHLVCYVMLLFVFVCSNYYPSTIWLFNIAMENGP